MPAHHHSDVRLLTSALTSEFCVRSYTVDDEQVMDYDSPIVESATDDLDLVLKNACRAALKKGLVSDPDDLMVVSAGLPFGPPGAANLLRIVPACGPACWDGVCRID